MKSSLTTLLSITLIFSCISVFGQGMRLKYAHKEFANLNFYYASEAYEDVLERTKDSSIVVPEIAESYLRIGNIEKAIAWYTYMNRNTGLSIEKKLELALLYREVGEYKKSNRLFESLTNTNNNLDDVVSNYISSRTKLSELQEESQIFTTSPSDLSTNSSDFSVGFGESNEMFISSSKRNILPIERRHGWTGDFFYNIYSVDSLGGKSKFNYEKDLSSKYNDAYVAFDSINDVIYFTRNNLSVKAKESEIRLILCRAKYTNGMIDSVEEVSFNDKLYSCAYPTISSDSKTLFFSSDMPGGFGGMDIYKVSVKSDGSFSEPINLGSIINTSLDEVTPHLKDRERVLFFSSKGHFGLGGLDVFVAKLSIEGDVKSVENLGVPINSRRDDFSFVNNQDQEFGYLVSNRSEKDNIYEFTQSKKITTGINVEGVVTDIKDSSVIGGAKIFVFDKNGNVLIETLSSSDGSFNVSLDGYSDDYSLEVHKSKYKSNKFSFQANDEKEKNLGLTPLQDYEFSGIIRDSKSSIALPEVNVYIVDVKSNDTVLSTKSNEEGKVKTKSVEKEFKTSFEYDVIIEKDGYITKREKLKGTFGSETNIDINEFLDMEITEIEKGKTDLGIIAKVEPIYFDLNSAEIRNDAAKELDKIYTILKDNPNIKMELRSHTDIRGDRTYNLKLSEKRAKSSVEYLIIRGISKSRLFSKGMGESSPIITLKKINEANSEEEKEQLHQLNRRTEFIVIE